MEPEEEPGGAAAREVYEEVRGRLSRGFTGGISGFLPGNPAVDRRIVICCSVYKDIV